ncbi:MAG: hypothetical protein HY606_03210 [Planctomycetes bacterium]|nr:hypothetical protein [Planctomycetota bacterium]
MGFFVEESDECMHWINLLINNKAADKKTAVKLKEKAGEILKICLTAVKTARSN